MIPEWYGEREVFYSNVGGTFLFINQGRTGESESRVILPSQKMARLEAQT